MTENNKYVTHFIYEDNDYQIKDKEAEERLNLLEEKAKSPINYRGVTLTPLSDGMETTSSIRINGENYFPKTGDVVIYKANDDKELEFIFRENNSENPEDHSGVWNEFGSTGSLKAMAFADKGTVTLNLGRLKVQTKTGENSYSEEIPLKGDPYNFTVTDATITNAVLNVSKEDATYEVTSNGTLENKINIKIDNNERYNIYKPAGTTQTKTLTGMQNQFVTVEVKEDTVSGNYIPTGDIVSKANTNNTTPIIPLTPSKRVIKEVTNVGELPKFLHQVNNEELKITWSAGSLTTVTDSDVVVEVPSPSMPELIFKGQRMNFSGRYNAPDLTIPPLTLDGTETSITAEFEDKNISVNGSLAGEKVTGVSLGSATISVPISINPNNTNWKIDSLTTELINNTYDVVPKKN